MKRFRGGLVLKAHILLYHSTVGLRVIKKKSRGGGYHRAGASNPSGGNPRSMLHTCRSSNHSLHAAHGPSLLMQLASPARTADLSGGGGRRNHRVCTGDGRLLPRFLHRTLSLASDLMMSTSRGFILLDLGGGRTVSACGAESGRRKVRAAEMLTVTLQCKVTIPTQPTSTNTPDDPLSE